MKRGHCIGTKRERRGVSDWFRHIEQENLERVEREWEERQAVASVLRQLPRQGRDEREE